jgi:hypothetical protein
MDSPQKPGMDRLPINFRIARQHVEAYDKLSHAYSTPGVHITRTDVIKAHLAVAGRYPDEVATTLAKIVEARR